MAEEKNEKPKIIVDDDWKTQAQVEKERLAEEAKKKEAKGDKAPEGGPEGGQREIPPASFATLVNSIAMQTMMALGGAEDPETKKRYVDLGLAKFNIDLLNVLAEKTKGNLDDEEKKLLDRVQYDLKMGFVQITQHVQKAQAAPAEEKKE